MNTDSKVWLNGNLIPWSEATVPLLSHGFSRGSAFFEVFGVHVGPEGPMALRMNQHLKRLMESARLLEMELAYSTEEIIAAVESTVAANNLGRGLIKMLAYWGVDPSNMLQSGRAADISDTIPLDLRMSVTKGEDLLEMAFPGVDEVLKMYQDHPTI